MQQPEVFDLLVADEPFHDYADKLMLFGQFVGVWDVAATWYDHGTVQRTDTGEWHFTWILGGRGIQDVLFATGVPSQQFGTTLRCYDPASDTWHVCWMQPAGGEFVHLQGGAVGDAIVLEGTGTDARRIERWSFLDITHDSFLWRGGVSLDQGVTWLLEQEMRAHRRAMRSAEGT